MRHRGVQVRRSPVEWTVRALLAVVALLLGYISAAQTLGYVLRIGDPERGHLLAPRDGRITALLAQRRSGVDASPTDRKEADKIAWRALWQEPTAVVAVSTLGLNAQLRGETERAQRLFGYSQALTRRDLQTQLWAIEDAVGRSDIAGALRHYDIALRASRSAPDLLYPVLGSAIADPDIRSALVRTLALRPAWRGSFIDYVSGNGPDPLATATLFIALRRAGVEIPESAAGTLVSTLVSRGRIPLAWRYYAATHPGADRRSSRDPNFTARPGTPSPFDWIMINDGGVSASFQQGDDGGLVDIAAPASVGGPVIEQMQVLPSGDYRLEGQITGIEDQRNAPYWLLRCQDGREVGRVSTASVQGSDRFAGRLTVPGNCPVQMLVLMLRPSDTISGVAGQLRYTRLTPVRPSS